MALLNTILPYLSLFLALCVTVGGVFAYRQNYAKTASEIQERVINTLKTEADSLRLHVNDCEKEIERLKQTIETILAALKKQGIYVTIDGDMILIEDKSGRIASMRKPRIAKDETA